ncbi:lipid droplet defective isoform X1 [Bombus vancouverensis nearcticus]|uniref:lipid droplet defective isoform X1 n=2 Tax=Bombus vancouverensis nearcticus TaxID=2705178 RepID=UPI00402BBAB6
MRVDQIGLLLWKNYIVRKRQPGILALVFVWPVVVFMILYTIRDNVDPKYYPTCQFPARSMPQDGLLPFVQSFICSVGNPCDPLSEYEEVPSYKNATLGPLVVELQPMLGNETILSAISTLPNSIQLLKSMAQILTRPEIKALFDRGIRLGDLFNNHEEIKNLLRVQMPYARSGLIDELFNSSIKLLYLIEAFGSSNIDGAICSPEILKKYLILPNEQNYLEISKILCDIDSAMIPNMLESLSKHLDFSGLLEMIDRVMAKFRDYDFFDDLRKAVETILDLQTTKKFVPQYLKLRQWVPKMIMVFKNVTFKEIDLTFVNKSLQVLDPVFSMERDWATVRRTFLRLQKLLDLAKRMVEDQTIDSSDSLFAIVQRLSSTARFVYGNMANPDNLTQILDLSIAILHDGAKLMQKILDGHQDEIQLPAEILDGLRDFLSDNILATLSYILSFMQTIVRMLHHAAIIHEDVQYRIYDISINHKDTVQKLLTNVDPNFYRKLVKSFSRLDFVEKFVDAVERTSPDDFFCQEGTLNEIFELFIDGKNEARHVKELLCSDAGKKFIWDVYESFEFRNFESIVSDSLFTVFNMALHKVVSVEKSNLTSLVGNTKELISYLTSPKRPDPDWSVFKFDERWYEAFEETRSQGRLNLLAIHLSIAKMVGSRSVTYIIIEPDLKKMNILAKIILYNLKKDPTSWIDEFRQRKMELVESFYLTVTDKDKALQILEYDNFTDIYCTNPDPPDLLNFPKDSNETVLKALICHISKSVQMDLEIDMSNIEQMDEVRYGNTIHFNSMKEPFNWTDFNTQTIEIYRYIDTLVHQEDPDYDMTRLEKARKAFETSWSIDIGAKDVFEMSVGLICKFFKLMESSLFSSKGVWKETHAIAWASSVIFEYIEKIVDQIQKNEYRAKLSELLQDMPQTEILLNAILRNLSPLILDVVDIITMKPIHLISVLDDYKSREEHWPCVRNESAGSAMEMREGTREIIREIERISCNPALFIQEWNEHPVFAKTRKILQHDKIVQSPPFNWTLGYITFRRQAKKLDDLVNDATQVILAEQPHFWEHWTSLVPEVKNIFDKRWPDMKNDAKNTLEYVDYELDKTVMAFQSNLSASNLWNPTISIENRILVLVKFVSHSVQKMIQTATNILRNAVLLEPSENSIKLNLFPLLGFDDKSPISIYYNKLSYVMVTLVNGLMNSNVGDRIFNSPDTDITCSRLFEWWSDSVVGFTPEEYRTLKNFTCDLDPDNFNAYTDLYMVEANVWTQPVNRYRSSMITVIGDIYDFAFEVLRLMEDIKEKKIEIEVPFSMSYVSTTLQKFKYVLEFYDTETNSQKKLERSNYRIFIEGVAEGLNHITNAIKNIKTQNNHLNIWDFVENGDARQLLKILDNHPEETIALVVTLSTLNSPTNVFMSYEDVRKTMCSFRFNSNYWSTPNRTRFIKEICSFDPDQLLKGVTSAEYYSFVTGQTTTMSKSTHLSASVTKLLDTALRFHAEQKSDYVINSKIFNATTWRNLSNDTWSVIGKAGQIWIERYMKYAKNENPTKLNGSTDSLAKLARGYQLLDATIELLAGGDIWQKLRILYENSRVKPILTLIEDLPNLIVTGVDTFVKSERLNDFVEKLSFGKLHPCDIDKYLIVPSFVRKKVLLSSITNFCQKIVLADGRLTLIDILPLDVKYEEGRIARNWSGNYDEIYLLEKLQHIESTIIRAASEGFKDPKVPAWWISFKEGTFEDFLTLYKKEDLKALAHLVVKKLFTTARNILNSVGNTEDCSWCVTFPLEILNSQLLNHQLYAKLLCQLTQLNISQIHDILMHDFYWNKTASMIKNYKYLNVKRNRNEFLTTLEGTFYHIAEILMNFQNKTYSDEINECFHRFVGRPAYSRPGLYVTMVLGVLDSLQKNVFILDTGRNHKNIETLSKMAEKYVPIWKPVRDVVKASDVDDVEAFLPGAMINVNALLNDRNGSLCRTKLECRNRTVLYNYLSSKKAGKVFQYDQKALGYHTLMEIADRLSVSLDLDRIYRELKQWQMDATWNLTWLKEILRHLSIVIGESGNLLDVASKIDFQDVSSVLGVPDIVDGVVNILKDKTVDKLFDGMKEIAEDIKPFIEDQYVMDDVYRIIVAFQSMDIFKNLGLLDMKYVIRDMFDNWDVVKSYLVDKIGISNNVALMLSQAKIDMISVFMKERRALSLKEIICSPTKLSEMLNFNSSRITAEEVSSAICQFEDSQTQNVTITLIKNLNFDYIFKTLMSANVKNILANANLTETEGKMVLNNLGVAAELLPFFKDKLSSRMPTAQALETDAQEPDQTVSTSKFLQDSSEMLCGQPMVSDNGDLYKIISKIEDNSKDFDKAELDSLPTEFCRNTYKGVVAMGGGKIIWSYVKPLLRGKILYAPNTTVINNVMTLANKTFVEMEHFGVLMNSFEKTLISLANLTEMSDSLRELRDIMSSDVIKIAIRSFGGSNFEGGDFTDMDLSEVSWRLKRSKRLITMVGMLNDLLECVLVDRIRGFRSEEEMEAKARVLMETREFLAGVVFLDKAPKRSSRSLQHELPDNIVYKIRMDVDYVQSTKRLKNQFWIPGPESSFIEHLRYMRGFVQLQDSIDRAIIRTKTQKDQDWKTMTQQMPYPCWEDVPFQTTLYESQGIQVCFFFALMMCVGAAVRHVVWERESQNAMVMSVMGLKPWRNTVAWFITTFIELLIVLFSIATVLLAGKILPKSDASLILIMMVDYAFSIVTFCYMISTMCSSASLAAITTVVMFLLTFMPYVIVIAMEAVIGLGYKLLICLSMSTSFCYGCLYAARKEVQGIGLTWSAMWEESSPGDSMSLGWVLLMIAFDGCLYALIGYLVARYTNSGRGFHDLRSRSLWWADKRSLYGRPSYLAFVNNLYFTNDVLHPSATYQDEESDASNLTVSEKQTGVRFENVKKIYNTDQGEVLAVDDFNLKLNEGEVTSLLGRNGAGKTTIIKMLTGMLAPTTGEICLNGEEGCKPDIGVCPQDNVLIGTLTPREHLMFYAKLKHPDDVDMQRSVNEMLTSLELGRQEHEPVYRLSGGTKRRLCVALAFLGSPKLVILDEPGAGVDPAARRRIWRLIDQHRIGRTVILSTHHLDEADILSDTVVVMHKGRILCTGSPLSLKMMHGRGYRLLVTFPSADREENVNSIERRKVEALKSVIEEVVPNAVTNEVSSTEVVVTLPFQGKNGLNNNIAQAAKILEDSRRNLGYSHFSLECDTLERVFLDLCSRAESGSSIITPIQDSVISMGNVGPTVSKNVDLIDIEPSLNPCPIRQIKALLKKRIWHFRKDWLTFLAGLLLPTMFVAVAMGFSLIRPPSEDEPPLVLTPKLYDTHPTYFYSIDNGDDSFLQHVSLQLHDRFGDDYAGAWQTLPNDTGTCKCQDGQQVCHGVSQAVEGLLQVLPGRPTLDWIVSTHQEYIEKRYGGWSLFHSNDKPLFVVWYNNKGHHALPSYLSALNEAILRASGVQGRLTTLNHPLKLSSDQLNRTTLLQHVADVGVALVLLLAFNLVAAQGSKELVRERLSEEKRILFLAGVHPVTYWITVLIWDFFVFGCSIALAVVVFEIFGLPAYVARDNLPGICLLLFLFAWAALPFSHLTEKAFDDSSMSNMVLFCVNTFIGVASLATILVLDILGKTKTTEDVRDILHYVLLIFPQYVLGDALVQISRNDITAQLLEKFHMDTYQSPLGWELLGLHYVFLTVVGAVLFSLNLMIECRFLPNWNRQRCPYEAFQEDDDVSKERMRVEGGMSDDILQTVKLRKEYRSVYGTNVAVQNLSIGVQAGKCFGLLGTNGAGKSTTFRMLTTEIIPTAGRIILRGKEIGSGPLCNGEIGYCPQSDGLDGFLSPHQCLTIHGEVCGLSNVPKAVESALKRLDLLKYAHKRVSSLSGGNKRKLCTALSVMAPVPVVLMDEPTSGMDPATKDLVAKTIRHMTKNQSCVILTSHSVAECENLCNRVGILAKAGLRCIGTPQHLKHKFGEGYVAFLRFRQPISSADLRRAVLKYFPRAVVSSRQASAARLLVPRSQDMLVSSSFNKLKLLAEELKATDYTLTQSSLDQVLVSFSEDVDNEIDGSVYAQSSTNNISNIYTNMDTIHMETF